MSISNEPATTPREGIALPIALAAIVIVGALITGVFFASMQEFRVGRNSLATQRAAHAAEVGLSTIVASWTTARSTGTKVGKATRMADTTIDGVAVKRQFTRVSPTVFWLTTTATYGGGAFEGRSVKRLNSIVRLEIPDLRIMGAVTTRNKVTVSGSNTISGNDTTLAGWDCPPAGAAGAGLVVNDSASNVTLSGGCAAGACLVGAPKVKDSTNLAKDPTTYTNFGGFTFDSLTKLADKVYDAGKVGADIGPKALADGVTCDRNHPDNWGAITQTDPPGLCDDYYPIIYLKGDQDWTINKGGGQGVLIADGNLKVTGNFSWRGLIIVKGVIKTVGNGGAGDPGIKVIGAIMAANKNNSDESTFSGNSSIQFSRCAISQVTSRIASAAPLQNRAWADLSY